MANNRSRWSVELPDSAPATAPKSRFTVEAPESPAPDDSRVLSDLFEKYPRLKNGNDPTKTKLIFANPDRIAKAKKSGAGGLEYFPPDEEGTPEFPHPSPGNTAVEIYDESVKSNPQLLRQSVFGDLLHGMRNDQIYKKYRDEFKNNFTPQSLAMEKQQGRGQINDSRVDEYVRGYVIGDQNDEFVKNHNAGQPV